MKPPTITSRPIFDGDFDSFYCSGRPAVAIYISGFWGRVAYLLLRRSWLRRGYTLDAIKSGTA